MLLDIVVIVLRETLEASMLAGVLLSLSRISKVRFHWFPVALLLGMIGAAFYANSLQHISLWFDYSGQEAVNASLQFIIYFLLVAIIALQYFKNLIFRNKTKLFLIFSTIAMTTAVTREGSELYVFFSGYLQSGAMNFGVITSGFIGLTLGTSIGAIVYFSLLGLSGKRARLIHTILLTLIAGGMVLQGTQLLIQVDWISAGEPFWDSNWLLPEASIAGQLIYAVFGYEATPPLVELVAYWIALGLALALVIVMKFTANTKSHADEN